MGVVRRIYSSMGIPNIGILSWFIVFGLGGYIIGESKDPIVIYRPIFIPDNLYGETVLKFIPQVLPSDSTLYLDQDTTECKMEVFDDEESVI